MLKIISVAILVSIVFSGAVTGCSTGYTSAQNSRPKTLAPDFQLQNLDGQTVALSDLRGRPVLINFWASWCGPCRFEMPFIQGIFEDEKFTNQGLVILAVNIGESYDTAREFMDENSLSFPVLLDTSQDVALLYNIRSIPTTYFIDEEGMIRDVKIGAFTDQSEIERRLVNSIIDDL